eukprot:114795-Pelagomonas_calceolata.AAC.1
MPWPALLTALESSRKHSMARARILAFHACCLCSPSLLYLLLAQPNGCASYSPALPSYHKGALAQTKGNCAVCPSVL